MKKNRIHKNLFALITLIAITNTKGQSLDSAQINNSATTSNNMSAQTNNQPEFIFSEKPDQSYKLIGPKVKGLSIGMRFQDAIAVIKEKVKGKKDLYGKEISVDGPFNEGENENKDWMIWFGVKPKGAHVELSGVAPGTIRADDKNAVCFIALPATFFDVPPELSIRDFTKRFMDAYAIPEFNPSNDGENFEYTDSSGVLISISGQTGEVLLVKVKSEKQIKASFD
jgi:hypothetical protein